MGYDGPSCCSVAATGGERDKLTRLVRLTLVRAALTEWSRIVMLVNEGISSTGIAEKLGSTRSTVITRWVSYAEAGIERQICRDLSERSRQIDHRVGIAPSSALWPCRPPAAHLWCVRVWTSPVSALEA